MKHNDIQKYPSWSCSLSDCNCCPRHCGADRTSNKLGYCQLDDLPQVASICAHKGEEPVISGEKGICNVFFGHCNLQCIYCQNFQISSNTTTLESFDHTSSSIIDKILNHLENGIKSVGFVSPGHCIPQVLQLMDTIGSSGKTPVFVYNSNGYDRDDLLRHIEGRFGVYLPDMKYMVNDLAKKFSDVSNYVEVASMALKEMYRQKGPEIVLDDDGLITDGMIVRHLVLPGQIENSKKVLRFLAEELSTDLHISLMSQYHPTPNVQNHPDLGRTLRPDEYDEVLEEFDRLGFYRGWVQELSSTDSYLPNFDNPHPFEQD